MFALTTHPDPLVQLFVTVFMGILGLLMGSFFNVCIYRIPAGLSVNKPRRSYCFTCGSQIKPLDNIPVLSFLLLGGACRNCGTPYSARYMGVELLTGCIFAALGWRFGAIGITPGLLLYAAFCSLMIIATFTDIDHFIIPDGISVGGGIAMIIATGLVSLAVFADLPTGLIAPIANGWPFDQEQVVQNFGALTPFLMALIGGLFGAGMLWGVGVIGKILFRKEAMGMGDVKLMIGIGAILGWFHTLVSFFLACVLGAVISLVVIAIQKMRGPVNQTVGEQFPALGGAIESAKQSALSAEQSDLESESEVIGEESEKDGTLFNQIGQQFAEESRKRAPYALKHLPFGPYLAVAAIITLFAHHLISRDANRTLYLLELRDRPPFVINYDTTPSQSLRYTP